MDLTNIWLAMAIAGASLITLVIFNLIDVAKLRDQVTKLQKTVDLLEMQRDRESKRDQ